MTYRIMDGKLHKQSVAGGRWEPVTPQEEGRVLSLASELATSDPEIRAITRGEHRQAEPA